MASNPITTESVTTDRTSVPIFQSTFPDLPLGKEFAPLPECEDAKNWMHILATMDVLPQKGGTLFKTANRIASIASVYMLRAATAIDILDQVTDQEDRLLDTAIDILDQR